MEKRRNIFENYYIEDKIWPGYGISRFSFIIIKKFINKRRQDLENQINACIVLEVTRSKNKKVFIVGNYRQWRGKSPQCTFNEYQNDHQVKRFKSLIDIWTEVTRLGPTLILGDINIDRHPENDPISCNELKDLILMLDDFQESSNVTLVNSDTTRH